MKCLQFSDENDLNLKWMFVVILVLGLSYSANKLYVVKNYEFFCTQKLHFTFFSLEIESKNHTLWHALKRFSHHGDNRARFITLPKHLLLKIYNYLMNFQHIGQAKKGGTLDKNLSHSLHRLNAILLIPFSGYRLFSRYFGQDPPLFFVPTFAGRWKPCFKTQG